MKTLAKTAGTATVYLVLASLMVGLLGCSEAGPVGVELEGESMEVQQDAVAPAKRALWGTAYSTFNMGFFADPTRPSWIGTVTIDDVEYGMVFYSLGAAYRGRSFHFEERWELYSWVDFDFVTQALTTGDLLMWGLNEGVEAPPPGNHFESSGRVEEAFGVFSMWKGRHLHAVGTVLFDSDGNPLSATGTFRWN